MKKKKGSIFLLGIIFLIVTSAVLLNTEGFNSEEGGCSCHTVSANITLTVLNATSVNVAKGTDFNLSFYASTTQTGGDLLTIRFLLVVGNLTFSPSMVEADSGIRDGGTGDPDSSVDDKIGDAGTPATVAVTDVPNDDTTIIIKIVAADGSPKIRQESEIEVVVGTGGDVERPLTWEEWFYGTQMPYIVFIGILFGVGVVASVVLQKSNSEEEIIDKKKVESPES